MQSAGSEVEASINRCRLAVRGGPRSPAPQTGESFFAFSPWSSCFLPSVQSRWTAQHFGADLLALFTGSKSASVTASEAARRLNRFHPQIPRPASWKINDPLNYMLRNLRANTLKSFRQLIRAQSLQSKLQCRGHETTKGAAQHQQELSEVIRSPDWEASWSPSILACILLVSY